MKPIAIWNCTKKKRYNTKNEAERQADFLSSTQKAYVDVYRCSICEGFHLTKQRANIGRKEKKYG